ncbi:hypothetical protein BTIS_1424 [Bifidobacterium tissieri]|uniref:Uncharacterized protein n=2 Tax=Bifidobacterium tissieri TaxID=1630162 RepID=A0A261FDT6_9BIFI|nr:hypothetical protein BTIS_1424 [Bifidobacterium tissieri]
MKTQRSAFPVRRRAMRSRMAAGIALLFALGSFGVVPTARADTAQLMRFCTYHTDTVMSRNIDCDGGIRHWVTISYGWTKKSFHGGTVKPFQNIGYGPGVSKVVLTSSDTKRIKAYWTQVLDRSENS